MAVRLPVVTFLSLSLGFEVDLSNPGCMVVVACRWRLHRVVIVAVMQLSAARRSPYLGERNILVSFPLIIMPPPPVVIHRRVFLSQNCCQTY
ncbi:hypothetical protein QBC40DRAFT_278573, partial [Triangularia verruculosa]